MYEKHFGLERRLFRGNAAGADVFVGPQTAKIMSGVKKALAGHDSVVAVSGPVGSGKSTTVAHSLGVVSGKNAIVRVGRIPLARGDVLDLLFDHMRIQKRPPRGNQKLALFRQLLFNLAANGSRMFVLVEDAPFCGTDVLGDLEVLTAADSGPSDGANLILMGDESLGDVVRDPRLARLRQRIRLRRELKPASNDELAGYLRHCFRRVGGDFDATFAEGTASLLHQLTGGILRVTNNLVESCLDAAAEMKIGSVDAGLVSRIADEEFGLTGAFEAPPVIEDDRPPQKHTDDATAELVALNLPEEAAGAPRDSAPEPAATAEPQPEPEPLAPPELPPAVEPEAVSADDAGDDDGIPDLIQDTQPELPVLPTLSDDDVEDIPELIQDTIPSLAALPETDDAIPTITDTEPADEPEPVPPPEQVAPAVTEPPSPPPAAAEKPVSRQPRAKAKPATAKAPRARPEPPAAKPPGPKPAAAKRKPPEAAKPPAPEPALAAKPPSKPEVPPSAPADGPDDVPAWDRDPTFAELRPDLEALERAMAVAHGRDPDAPDEPEAVEPPPPAEKEDRKDATPADVPQITLDESIRRKVDLAELEVRARQAEELGIEVEDEEDDEAKAEAERARKARAEAELEKIAAGLAKAKTIDDVDDKMAETLFGEELSIAAAEVRALTEAAAEKPANDAPSPEPPAPSGAGATAPAPPQSAMEKQFENVRGTTGEEVSIEAQPAAPKGGIDLSASQRLATVRALNAENPGSKPPAAAPAKPATPEPAAEPQPIEEQITTSMTQTLKTLTSKLQSHAVNDDGDDDDDDDDDDEDKSGFFSRFRRS